MEPLFSLSVLDGRYHALTESLRDVFSEYGLIRHRVIVEVEWLKFLAGELTLFEADAPGIQKIDAISSDFDADAAKRVKEIEKTTNHDVKAVEYYIKEQLEAAELMAVKEWVHFSCTSEDINNTAYALMVNAGRELVTETAFEALDRIESLGKQYKAVPMMSRTHGQPASPTTIGKEFINFAWRLRDGLESLNRASICGKFNGATGNFNAHYFVYPEVDWIDASRKFLSEYLGIVPLMFTTQINPYGYVSAILHDMIRIASIVVDLDRDMWGYISFGYFKQRLQAGEVGSSTMPHKVNPIDFENSEGNMGLAISQMEHLAVKLLNSRFQRDLSDSTVLRNLGALMGYFQIGLKNTIKGLGKIDVNARMIEQDLDQNLELLAEPIQTAMRVFGESNPYEKLKELTRGKKITQDALNSFIEGLEKVPSDVKERMKALSVEKYIGLAEKLVDQYFDMTGPEGNTK